MDVLAHLPALRRYALVLTRNPDRADDLVQEALVRALEGADTWRPGRDVRAWLLSILHNAFISSWRHQQAGEAAIADKAILEHAFAPAQQGSRIRFGEVVDALLDLPLELRQPLALVVFDGMSYQEAATLLQIPVGTLMSRISRARAALREATGDNSTVKLPSLKVVK